MPKRSRRKGEKDSRGLEAERVGRDKANRSQVVVSRNDEDGTWRHLTSARDLTAPRVAETATNDKDKFPRLIMPRRRAKPISRTAR